MKWPLGRTSRIAAAHFYILVFSLIFSAHDSNNTKRRNNCSTDQPDPTSLYIPISSLGPVRAILMMLFRTDTRAAYGRE